MWSGFAEKVANIPSPWRKKSNSAMEEQREINPEDVATFLKCHPEFLEKYVSEEVELEQLERWMIRKAQRTKKKLDNAGTNGRKTSLSRWKFCVHADKRKMLQELTKSLQLCPAKSNVLLELAACICSAVGAEGFRLHLSEAGDPELETLYLSQDDKFDEDSRIQRLIEGRAGPGLVARTKEAIRLSKTDKDPRFPGSNLIMKDVSHVLYQPIIKPNGQLAAVLELWRTEPLPAFHEEDEEIATSYLVWGGIALHYAHLYLSINKQRELNEFLLAVVKSIFQDMVSMDVLIIKIMNFAQKLVNADRASLFLVDSKTKELYARIFDVGSEEYYKSEEQYKKLVDDPGMFKPLSREIRFPLNTGIAGHVAMTGDVLNIADAYSDPRFNRSIDQMTGYHTDSILCMPIFIQKKVIGVVQMVNKCNGTFDKEDEEAFEMFAVYCGLALHHAKLYDKIARSEQKYRVALEVLSYHSTCSEAEIEDTKQSTKQNVKITAGIDEYYFDVFSTDEEVKVSDTIFMFEDLFGIGEFDQESVIRFVLTVRKNYRRVPYHNWTHGFSVANTMYCILKRSTETFKPIERLALYVGSLCHDLDHRGKNNQFMLETESPLAAMYSTSTMEHHHFNQTVTILQQKGHNIFSKLSNCDYKDILSLLKHCILATDLALFFKNREMLTILTTNNLFSWENKEHRLLLNAITMTASDLSASAKPWAIQVKTVKVIFQEFYEQGDAERAAGKVPLPMMDRLQPDQQASSQVGFINGICIPCYSLLSSLIPSTRPLLEQCQSNLQKWQKIDREKKKLDTYSSND